MTSKRCLAKVRERRRLASCLALICCAAHAGAPQPEVINGVVTKAWPGMGAFLIVSGQFASQCSAALIAPNWVLTAAHCLENISGTVMFTIDQDYQSPSTTYYTPDAIYVHPNHNANGSSPGLYDAGLMHFATPIPAMPFRLNDDPNRFHVGDKVQFIGYGTTNAGLNSIRHIGTTTLSHVDTFTMESQSGAFVCEGDSGAAWFARNGDGFPLLAAITSAGDQGCNAVSIASTITSVLPYIASHVTDLCLTSTVGAPCDGIFRSDLEAAP